MIEIYTDGGSRGNPGPGGFGVVALEDDEIIFKVSQQFNENVTNNQMELLAILTAIKKMNERTLEDTEYVIYSDSAYCVNALNTWIFNWATNGWQNTKKQRIENYELFRELWQYVSGFRNFTIKKVSGHSGIVGNELADALSTDNSNKFNKILKEKNIKYRFEDFELIY